MPQSSSAVSHTRTFNFYPLESRILLDGDDLDFVDAGLADPAVAELLLAELSADGQWTDTDAPMLGDDSELESGIRDIETNGGEPDAGQPAEAAVFVQTVSQPWDIDDSGRSAIDSYGFFAAPAAGAISVAYVFWSLRQSPFETASGHVHRSDGCRKPAGLLRRKLRRRQSEPATQDSIDSFFS